MRKPPNRRNLPTCETCGVELTDKRSSFCKKHTQLREPKKCKHCPREIPVGSRPTRTICGSRECVAERKKTYHRTERLKMYGFSHETFKQTIRAQGGVCALCRCEPTGTGLNGGFLVDHDHASGKVRGLLCRHCNTGLGHFKDDPELLVEAANYVRQYREAA